MLNFESGNIFENLQKTWQQWRRVGGGEGGATMGRSFVACLRSTSRKRFPPLPYFSELLHLGDYSVNYLLSISIYWLHAHRLVMYCTGTYVNSDVSLFSVPVTVPIWICSVLIFCEFRLLIPVLIFMTIATFPYSRYLFHSKFHFYFLRIPPTFAGTDTGTWQLRRFLILGFLKLGSCSSLILFHFNFLRGPFTFNGTDT